MQDHSLVDLVYFVGFVFAAEDEWVARYGSIYERKSEN